MGGLPKPPNSVDGRSVKANPRSAMSAPAGSFQAYAAATSDTSPRYPRLAPSQRASNSVPIVRNSSPSQVFSADGVMEYTSLHPGPRFSSEIGMWNATMRTRQRSARGGNGG